MNLWQRVNALLLRITYYFSNNFDTYELANNYVQNKIGNSGKEQNGKLSFFRELRQMRKSCVKNVIVGQLNANSYKINHES